MSYQAPCTVARGRCRYMNTCIVSDSGHIYQLGDCDVASSPADGTIPYFHQNSANSSARIKTTTATSSHNVRFSLISELTTL